LREQRNATNQGDFVQSKSIVAAVPDRLWRGEPRKQCRDSSASLGKVVRPEKLLFTGGYYADDLSQ
jgi:hypothetical protein